MGMLLSPEPNLFNSVPSITINVNKTSDIECYAFTTNNIPPVIAKYIAYDNLTPANPFIATVEDGLGNILLDGGFPKWYNDFCNAAWSTYNDLSPSFKYLYDAIDFISNKIKVDAGNKKILILGDQADPNAHYYIKDGGSGKGGFKLSIDTVCRIKGYTPIYKTSGDYGTGVIDANFSELEQYCCVLFFSTYFTNLKLISDLCIQSLISYRENGNGIFIITDHGDRVLNNMAEALDPGYAGFYRNANYLVTNFGCYFSGDYNRSPVNVGFLRANYGNHPLWKNLSNSDYIFAGGSESKIIVTEYPLYYGSHNVTISANGYYSLKILIKFTDGTLKSESYTYGLNMPEIIYFFDAANLPISTPIKETFLKRQPINFKVKYIADASGHLKYNSLPIGVFNYNFTNNSTNKALYTGVSNNLSINNNETLDVQLLAPINYSKKLNIKLRIPNFDMRANKVLNQLNDLEFKFELANSSIRNLNKLLSNKSIPTRHYINRFHYKNIYNYFYNIDQPVLFDPGLNKPVIEALIYADPTDLNYELINRVPQTPLSIFNSWGRFDGDNYYNDKASSSGNAAAWIYNSASNAVEMPLNVEPTNGFVSNLLYDSYEFEITATSADADDDTIGIIAAFVRENDKNYYICLTANMGGFEPQPQSGIGVFYNYIRSTEYENLYTGSIGRYPSPDGWRGKTVKLKIKREGDIIQFWNSQVNSENLSLAPQFTLDLNSDPRFGRFKGKQKYGYMTLSQPYCTYKNIKFVGGLENLLIDPNSRSIYEFDLVSQKWVKSSTNILSKFGAGVLIYNPEQTNPTKMKLYKFTETQMFSYGPYQNYTSTTGLNFDKSLVLINNIGPMIKPLGKKIKKIWLEFETDIQRNEIYSLDFVLNGNIITFPNPTTYNLNGAIILTELNEMYKLTEFGLNYLLDSVTSFKYISYN